MAHSSLTALQGKRTAQEEKLKRNVLESPLESDILVADTVDSYLLLWYPLLS
ncbi:hypothetical protein M758_3G083900 [Ceratodon purpureus]|nr:hypothetical protein M758_3G083900 [Ceratodon purpureus]